MSNDPIKLDLDAIFAKLNSAIDDDTPQYVKYGFPEIKTDQELKHFIENNMFVYEHGPIEKITLHHKMLEFIADFFFLRQRKGITTKTRGTGGTLALSIIIFLMGTYHNKSFSNMAGSGDQAKQAYDYIKAWFEKGFPKLREYLKGNPTGTMITLKNGVKLRCSKTSEAAVRSKHFAGLALDEVVQADPRPEKIMRSALGQVLTMKDFMILMLSTRHLPHKLFDDYWKNHVKYGFKRYEWNIYDCMKKCNLSIDCRACDLTRSRSVKGKDGKFEKIYEGCNGQARTSDGWMTRQHVLDMRDTIGVGHQWLVEYENASPTEGLTIVYDNAAVDRSVVDCGWEIDETVDEHRIIAGIDFGFTAHSAVVIAVYPCFFDRKNDVYPFVGITETQYFRREGPDSYLARMIDICERYELQRDKLVIICDSAGSHVIEHLLENGFLNMHPVSFKEFKASGVENCILYFYYGRIKILASAEDIAIERRNGEFVALIKDYRRNEDGSFLKKHDHYPDALCCAMLGFMFREMFADFLIERYLPTNADVQRFIETGKSPDGRVRIEKGRVVIG